MQKQAFIKAVIIMLAFASYIRADVSVIVNGSFEDDGIIADITAPEPNGWDVNLPPGQFDGWVFDEWPRCDSNRNLTLYSDSYQAFEVNDMATLSQEVILWDVNSIIFDIKLGTSGSNVWDPNKRTAIIMIDDEVIWESNDVGLDVRDEYPNETINISGPYDRGLHILSIGLRADVNEGANSIKYYTDWDCIRFDLHCGDFGFLDGDFTRDCYVDANDLRMLAQVWLQEVDPYDKCNLFSGDDLEPYGVINFHDFAVYSETWDGNTADLKNFVDVWLGEVEPNNIYNLFSTDDLEPNGVINFFDFAVFAEDWGRSSYD